MQEFRLGRNLSVSQACLCFWDTWRQLETVMEQETFLKGNWITTWTKKIVSYLLDRATERATVFCSVNVLVNLKMWRPCLAAIYIFYCILYTVFYIHQQCSQIVVLKGHGPGHIQWSDFKNNQFPNKTIPVSSRRLSQDSLLCQTALKEAHWSLQGITFTAVMDIIYKICTQKAPC